MADLVPAESGRVPVTALTRPLVNAASAAIALAGMAVVVAVYRKNKHVTLARRTMVFGMVAAAVLLPFFPFSELGLRRTPH